MNRKQKLINEIANLVVQKLLNESYRKFDRDVQDIFDDVREGEKDFSGLDFSGLVFTRGPYGDNYLAGIDFSRSNLSGAKLKGIELTYANLEGADLTGADLSDTGMFEAKLKGAIFTKANLKGADLEDAEDIDKAIGLDTVEYDERTVWPIGFKPKKV